MHDVNPSFAVSIIESVFEWLGNIVSVCNKELGTPYERCTSALDQAVDDCKDSLGDVVGNICNVTYIAKVVCAVLKPIDVICVAVDYVSNEIIAEVRQSSFRRL